MADLEVVKEKTSDELQAEQDSLKSQIDQHKKNLADENERLKLELDALKRANAKAKTCPGCGSDLHVHCALPSHMQDRKVPHPDVRG